MNLPASASSFMTPSCCRCRSISLHTINIQMKFLSVLSKASRHWLFSQFFFPPANVEHLFINLLFQPIPFQFLSSHKKHFFPLLLFLTSFSAEVHEYYFTLHCGCISIDQEIKTWVRGMRLDPAGLLTTEKRVTIPLFPPAVAQQTRAGGGST